jgi:hypothetical protein
MSNTKVAVLDFPAQPNISNKTQFKGTFLQKKFMRWFIYTYYKAV